MLVKHREGPKTCIEYIRHREDMIESDIALTGLWDNEQDMYNVNPHHVSRESTSTNVRFSMKSKKIPRSMKKSTVREKSPPAITLTALWPEEEIKGNIDSSDNGALDINPVGYIDNPKH